jgi:hypothetical protein
MNASSEQIAFLSVLIVGVLLVVALLRPQLSDIQRRVATLARLEAKLDLLMKHAGIQYEPYKDLPGDVVDALQRGEKIEAIKRYRARISSKRCSGGPEADRFDVGVEPRIKRQRSERNPVSIGSELALARDGIRHRGVALRDL